MMELSNSLLAEARDIARTLTPEDGPRELDAAKIYIAAEGALVPECYEMIMAIQVECNDGVERSFNLFAKT